MATLPHALMHRHIGKRSRLSRLSLSLSVLYPALCLPCLHAINQVHALFLSVCSFRARFIAGAMSGGAAALLLYPLDVLKTQVTLLKLSSLASKQPIPSMPSWTAAQDLWRRSGFRVITRGIGVSTVGAALHNGLIFMAYFSLRSWWPADAHVVSSALAFGALAGCFAQLTYPFDLIRKTALQQHLHSFDTVHMLVRHGGILGLYKGSVANLIKVRTAFSCGVQESFFNFRAYACVCVLCLVQVAPFFAIQFAVYEAIVRLGSRD